MIFTEHVEDKVLRCFPKSVYRHIPVYMSSGVPRNFFWGGGGSTNSVEERGQNGDLGCVSPLVRGSGDICNLVQEIPFHIVKLS